MNTEIKFNAAPKSLLWFSAWAATFDAQWLPWQIPLESLSNRGSANASKKDYFKLIVDSYRVKN